MFENRNGIVEDWQQNEKFYFEYFIWTGGMQKKA